MKKLNAKGMEKINEISTKYRFRDAYELEQEEVSNFCQALYQAYHLGLSIDDEDLDFIELVIENG